MKRTLKLTSVLMALVLMCSALASSLISTAAEETLDYSMTLHQEGNQLFNEKGQAVRLLGVNIPQFGWSLTGEDRVEELIDMALNDWQSNVIRLPVKPNFWLGRGSTSAEEAAAYRERVDAAVAQIAAAGKYVILDNHSFYLPGEDSELFWADAAEHYKDHPNVIFGLFNEPAACTWTQYFEGATDFSYEGENEWGQQDTIRLDSKGVPNLLKIVRATGAKNVVTISGLTWGFDLQYMTPENFREFAENQADQKISSGELTQAQKSAWVDEYIEKYGIQETTGNGIIFETHPYPEREDDWDAYLYDTLMQYPVVVGECGPTENKTSPIRVLSDNDKSYLDKLTSYMDKYGIHLTAWSVGAWPYLTQNTDLTKPSAYGEVIRDYIIENNTTKAVQLYTEPDYKGELAALYAGKYNASDLSGFDLSKLASVSAKDDYYQYVVTFYEEANQGGRSYSIVPNASQISTDNIGFTPASILIERQERVNILPDHATATANGSEEGYTPDLAIDGKTSTYWMNRSDTYSELVIKLDGVYALNGITLCHAAEAGMLSSDNSRSYSVSLSTNGVVYNRVVDVQNNGLGYTSYFFDQTPASYIRVQIREGGLIEPDVAFLAEVMAYGSSYNGAVTALPGRIPGSGTTATTAGGTTATRRPTAAGTTAPAPTDTTETTAETVTDPTTQITEPVDVPDRTYYMDDEGNIYYVDDNGDKVLVDETGREIGRIPQDNVTDATTPPDEGPVIWPFVVGGIVLVVIAAVIVLLVVLKKKKTRAD